MDKYFLNASYGEWSSGTEVDILEAQPIGLDGEVTVSPVNSPVDTYFDVPIDLLTRRRNHTDIYDAPLRSQRRKGMDEIWRLEHNG